MRSSENSASTRPGSRDHDRPRFFLAQQAGGLLHECRHSIVSGLAKKHHPGRDCRRRRFMAFARSFTYITRVPALLPAQKENDSPGDDAERIEHVHVPGRRRSARDDGERSRQRPATSPPGPVCSCRTVKRAQAACPRQRGTGAAGPAAASEESRTTFAGAAVIPVFQKRLGAFQVHPREFARVQGLGHGRQVENRLDVLRERLGKEQVAADDRDGIF